MTATTTYPNFIAGRSVDATDYSTDLNPSNLGDIVGEFARGTPNDAESAIFATLTPDAYTAIVRGKNATTGVALVEVYNVTP